jgi:6-phosphogluconolactonase
MVVFLVTGSSKAPIVQAVLEPRTSVEQGLPAAMVKPRSGRLVWMLDQAAAAQLNGMNQGTGFTRNA